MFAWQQAGTKSWDLWPSTDKFEPLFALDLYEDPEEEDHVIETGNRFATECLVERRWVHSPEDSEQTVECSWWDTSLREVRL